jgi:predicted metal-dependent hydrolase
MIRRSTTYGTAVIEYTLRRSVRRTLSISVDAEGILVIAPEGVDGSAVDERVRKRARWILRQQRRFEEFKPKTPLRRFVGGETHRYLGRQYRLKIEPSEQDRVRLLSGRLVVESREPRNPSWTATLVGRWMRQRAGVVLRERYEAAATITARLGIPQPRLMIRSMQKRWGSHTPSGRIILNDRLIAARRECIDYVIVHEICHVVVPNHSPRFFRLLRRFMPDWEQRKEMLERSAV